MSADRPNFVTPSRIAEAGIATVIALTGAGSVAAQSPSENPNSTPLPLPIVEPSPFPTPQALDCGNPTITVAVNEPPLSSPLPGAEPTPIVVAQQALVGDSSVGGETGTETTEAEDPYVKYSIESLIAKKYDPMDKAEFMDLARRCAPKIVEFTQFEPEQDTVEELVVAYEQIVDSLISNGYFKDDGTTMAIGSLITHLRLARTYIPTDLAMSEAMWTMTEAFRGILQQYSEIEVKGKIIEAPIKVDKGIDRLIEERY